MVQKKEKRNYDNLKLTAEGMFISQGLNSREIAQALELSEVTISRWRNTENWDEKRDFIRITPLQLRDKLLREAQSVAEGNASKIKADVIVKLLAGADKLAQRVTADVVYEVLKQCCEHIATINPDFAAQMAPYHKIFLQFKMQQEG